MSMKDKLLLPYSEMIAALFKKYKELHLLAAGIKQ